MRTHGDFVKIRAKKVGFWLFIGLPLTNQIRLALQGKIDCKRVACSKRQTKNKNIKNLDREQSLTLGFPGYVSSRILNWRLEKKTQKFLLQIDRLTHFLDLWRTQNEDICDCRLNRTQLNAKSQSNAIQSQLTQWNIT